MLNGHYVRAEVRKAKDHPMIDEITARLVMSADRRVRASGICGRRRTEPRTPRPGIGQGAGSSGRRRPATFSRGRVHSAQVGDILDKGPCPFGRCSGSISSRPDSRSNLSSPRQRTARCRSAGPAFVRLLRRRSYTAVNVDPTKTLPRSAVMNSGAVICLAAMVAWTSPFPGSVPCGKTERV